MKLNERAMRHIFELAKKEGIAPIRNELIIAGAGPTTAELLCKGQYISDPKDRLTRQMLAVIAKYGIRLKAELVS